MRWRCANQKTGGCRQTSMSHITLKPGRMKFCQLRARHMSGCNFGMHTPNRKRIASSPLVKPRKNLSRTTFLTARGRPLSCAKNCTKPAGVSPTYLKKLLDDVGRSHSEQRNLRVQILKKKNRAEISFGAIMN